MEKVKIHISDILQLLVTSRLVCGIFSDAEANFIGAFRRHTLIRGVTISYSVNWIKFYFIRVIKSRRMGWTVRAICRRGEERRGQ
jgi:hypothetical protein